MPKNICGQCQEEFDNEDQYGDHQCSVTGFTPRQPEHFGDRFDAISEAAQERGAEREGEEA